MSKATGEQTNGAAALMLTAPEDELPSLAARMGKELDVIGAYYCRREGLDHNTADHHAAQAREFAPRDMQWYHLSAVAYKDAEAGAALWAQIKGSAAQELRSGIRAWEAIAPPDSTPHDRARFLEMRRAFMEDWKPSGAIEGTMIDQIAQQLTLQFYWQEKLTQRTCHQAAQDLRDREKLNAREQQLRWGEWIPERVSEKDMIEQAAACVERCNRMYVRLIRTLRDLRRVRVTIQGAGQVNIADKQVNTATGGKAPAKKRRTKGGPSGVPRMAG